MHRSYFTIAEIMLVIAVTAIFLSAGRVVLQDQGIPVNIRQLLIMRSVSGQILGAIIGIGIGGSRRRWIMGIIWGFFVGQLVGGVAATLISLPQSLPLALIGSAILLLAGIAVRVLSRKAPEDCDSSRKANDLP